MNILDHQTLTELFRQNYLFFLISLVICVFILTYYLMPKILWVSHEKQLVKDLNHRSSHDKAIPNFGGVAFFMVFVLVISILQSLQKGYAGNHLIAAMTILFMVGLKDDLVISTARVKLFGQITAAFFIIFSPELHFNNLYGFLGFYEIPEILSYFLKAIFVVAIINSYNLIDGIDGLAAIIGMVVSISYTFIFYQTGFPYFALISVSLFATLAAYLRFNFSNSKRKIFMGDCGSLIIGLLIAFLSLKLLVMKPVINTDIHAFDLRNKIPFLLVVLFLPIFDTIRVMLIRIFNGNSPFHADKNHIHHLFLEFGFKHWQTSLLLGGLNILLITIFIYSSALISNFGLLMLAISMYFILFILLEVIRKMTNPTLSEKLA